MSKFYVECGDFRWVQNIYDSIIEESIEEINANSDFDDVESPVEQLAMQMATINGFNYWMDKHSPDGPLKMGPEVYVDQRGYRNNETADDETIVVETAMVMQSIEEMIDLEDEE